MPPLFSIIVASYNNGKYIAECLDSLIQQTYPNIEIIVVDDASTDNSVEVIRELTSKHKNIKYHFKKKNRGVGHTKFTGAKMASGTLIGTIGADDKLENKAIELMVEAHAVLKNAGLIYSTLYFCNHKLEIQQINKDIKAIPKGETYLSWEKSTSGTISGFRTMKRTFYEKTEGFSPYFKKAVDRDIIFKMEEVAATWFLNAPLYYYRLHDFNISRNKNAWQAKLWEVRAKEKAYYRRLGTNIPNITKQDVMREYYHTYKMLAAESLADKKYGQYLKYMSQFAVKFKNPVKILTFVYYTIKKHWKPDSFNK